MNQVSQDLEANLLEESNYYVDERLPHDLPQDDMVRAPESNPFQQITSGLDGSPKHNILAIMVSICKIVATIVILSLVPHTCLSFAEIWLVCMLVHDILNIVTVTLRLKNIYALRNISQNILEPILAAEQENHEEHEEEEYDPHQEMHEVEARRLEQENELDEEDDEPKIATEPEFQLSDEEVRIADEILQRMKTVKLLSRISFAVWSVLFVTGIWLYAIIGEVPTCQISDATNLLLVYLVMSGIWLFSPILLALLLLIGCIFGCILLPLLILVLWIIERPKPANRDAIKKLPIIKYSAEVPGEKQCVICMVEYQEGEKLVQLRCSSMHHFHEKCGKKWFKINGQCPMCRERIDQRPENPDDVDEDEEIEYQN